MPLCQPPHKRVVKMGETIVTKVKQKFDLAGKDLAAAMGLQATDVLKKVWMLGMRSALLDSHIDYDTASLVAWEFEWCVESTVFQVAK